MGFLRLSQCRLCKTRFLITVEPLP
jgi:hypothetical protein